jgi:TRAP-type C4-dicarboxylate transport system permease small subunit
MPALALWLARLLAPISRAALWIAAIGLVLMTIFVTWQVFGRKVLNDTPTWTEPGSLLLMSWFILLGGAVGVRESDHMGFEIGLHFAPPPLRLLMQATTFVLIITFSIFMTIYGWQLTVSTWQAKMAGINIPQGMDYLPLVGGGALMALFAFEKLVGLFVPASRAGSEKSDPAAAEFRRGVE